MARVGGSKRQAVEVIADSVQFLGGRDGGGGDAGGGGNEFVPAGAGGSDADFGGAGGADDDIPF
jgi:single-strand DNA-binding protein